MRAVFRGELAGCRSLDGPKKPPPPPAPGTASCRLPDASERLGRLLKPRLNVLHGHHGADLNGGVDRHEERLGDGWNLRRFLEVEDDQSGALAVLSGEVGRLRLELSHHALHGSSPRAIPDRPVRRLGFHLDLEQHPHGALSLDWWPETESTLSRATAAPQAEFRAGARHPGCAGRQRSLRAWERGILKGR